MKKIFTLCLIMALSLGAYAQTKKIALLEPRIGEGSTDVSAMEKAMVRGELRKAIVNESGYEAFTRADIDQIMKEQNFQRTGMVSNDQIKRLGEMSGADYICISTLTKSSTEFYLEAYLINVEDGGISNPATQYGELVNGKLANMLPVCKDLAKELVNSSGGRSNYIGGNNSRGSSSATNSVTDCQGHTYPVVKIGSQYWMAENLQCTKYDTKSERSGYYISTSENLIHAPYYTDSKIKANWDEGEKYVSKLSEEQIARFGLLYNWAAAMGYTEDESNNQYGDYVGNRQGICPNGWHIPNNKEWGTLYDYIYKDNALTNNQVGMILKSVYGWSNKGIDKYGFCGLPVGFAQGKQIYDTGRFTAWWSSSTTTDTAHYFNFFMFDNKDYLASDCYDDSSFSVRCIKD